MSPHGRRFYEFGPFRLDTAQHTLTREGEKIAVPPKAFDTLLVLIENKDRVMDKGELLKVIWPDTFVEDANLAVNISVLRKLLGERDDGGQYIETIPRRGYRFAATVREMTEGDPEAISEKKALDPDTTAAELARAQAATLSEASFPIIKRAPETRYAKSGKVNIAYQVVGDGPLDLVFVMGWVSHVEYFWAEPSFARFLSRLASFSRLILFDKRGTGLSDRVPVNELPTLEQRMDDVRAVMKAVGSEHAALIGVSEGGPMCSMFSATYPEKTTALVMIGTYAKRLWDIDYPWAPTLEEREKFYEEIEEDWGGPVGLEERAPTLSGDRRFRDWWATYLRMGASPGAALALTQMNAEIDVRHLLPSIRVPTLVIHRKEDRCLRVEEGRYVAERIPGAKLVELEGQDHLPFVGDQDAILDEVEEFLTGVRHHTGYDRVLATVMFSHVMVDLAGVGPSSDKLDRFRAHAKKEIELFRGREAETSADHFMAVFDGPGRAIRCAVAIRDAARRLGISTRTGLHTGECDAIGDKIGGNAVETGVQVAGIACESEVLVSRTVKDLVAGSGLKFEDRGLHSFGDALGEWQLFAAQ
ncbi:MAG TPA: alpha/beta fold hydrolase [Blastocatellia bacterium]|nr:alpha/beta fold hydrolase [Blastocatellia bacterium]